MSHIIYCMQFKGAAAPGAESGVLKATTSATSCNIKSVVGPDGIEGKFTPAEGGMAFFESEVRITAPDSFLESGTITFGEGGHLLRFSTVGKGHLGPSAESKTMAGAVTWKVEGGEGQFQGATGLITSNFFLTESGEVTDYHVGVIFIQ